MKGAIIHGVLLAVMLVYGYRTWTRENTTTPEIGSVVLWDRSDADLVSIEFKSDKKIVKLERRSGGEAYWWGSDTTIEKKPKPPTPPPPANGSGAGSGSAGSAAGSGAGSGSAAGSGAGSGSAGSAAGSGAGSGSAGSGAGSGSAAAPAVAEEEVRKTREFPLGDTGDKLVKSLTAARALRDLGKPTDDAKKDYKLTDAKTTLTVTFKDGSRSFLIGGSVYGGSDRYALEPSSGKAFVLSKDLISGLEVGESSLHLTDPRGFDAAKIESVTIDAGGKSKTAVRVQAGGEGQQVKTWGDEATKKPNSTMANFIDNANNLRPTEYSAELKTTGLEPVVTLTYKDERGAILGTLALYKHQKPAAALPEGAELDPANPPQGETEYFIMTPRTRVAAIVRKDTAERAEQDVPTVFSDKPVESVDPKGNPFGKVPPGALNPHGAMPPGLGSGAPGPGPGGPRPPGPPAGPGSAAPAPTPGAGSAAAPKAAGPTPPAAVAPKAPAATAPAATPPAAVAPKAPAATPPAAVAPKAPAPTAPAAAAPKPPAPAPAPAPNP